MARRRPEEGQERPTWPAKHPWDKLPRGGTHPYVPPRRDWLRNPPRGEEDGYLDASDNEWKPHITPDPDDFHGDVQHPMAATPTSGRMVKSSTGRITSDARGDVMSAITETEPGGEMVCIVTFSARPRDSQQRPIAGTRREFRVGERVRLVSSFFKDSPPDNPTGPMAIFEPLGEEARGPYVATGNYFVSLDCWAGLETYFREVASGREARSG